jgi:hypothetical protein
MLNHITTHNSIPSTRLPWCIHTPPSVFVHIVLSLLLKVASLSNDKLNFSLQHILDQAPMAKASASVRFKKVWRTSLHQASIDLRGRWRRACAWLFLMGLCTCLEQLNVFVEMSGHVQTACPPDGIFRLEPATFSYWSKSGFFQITLGFGELSFTVVKVIDIVWDVVSVT